MKRNPKSESNIVINTPKHGQKTITLTTDNETVPETNAKNTKNDVEQLLNECIENGNELAKYLDKKGRLNFHGDRIIVATIERPNRVGPLILEDSPMRKVAMAVVLHGNEKYKNGNWLLISEYAINYVDTDIMFNIKEDLSTLQTAYDVRNIGFIGEDDIIAEQK